MCHSAGRVRAGAGCPATRTGVTETTHNAATVFGVYNSCPKDTMASLPWIYQWGGPLGAAICHFLNLQSEGWGWAAPRLRAAGAPTHLGSHEGLLTPQAVRSHSGLDQQRSLLNCLLRTLFLCSSKLHLIYRFSLTAEGNLNNFLEIWWIRLSKVIMVIFKHSKESWVSLSFDNYQYVIKFISSIVPHTHPIPAEFPSSSSYLMISFEKILVCTSQYH